MIPLQIQQTQALSFLTVYHRILTLNDNETKAESRESTRPLVLFGKNLGGRASGTSLFV